MQNANNLCEMLDVKQSSACIVLGWVTTIHKQVVIGGCAGQ